MTAPGIDASQVFFAVGALNRTLTVACAVGRNNRDQIHLVAVRASQINQKVVLCGNCRHAQALSHACREV
jgi:uncharacterized CHY-type Zn-finger protein